MVFSHASVVVTYYIKLFRLGTNGHNGVLTSPHLLVIETKTNDGEIEKHTVGL